jgi:predicted ester cyclase
MPTRTSAPPPAPTPPGPTATPSHVVRWIVDVVNAHQPAALRAVLTDETRLRLPDTTHRGAEEILTFWDGVLAAVPDLTLTIQATAEQDDTVFVRWTLTGTHSGAPWAGVGPTGARLDLDGVDQATVVDGKVAAHFVIVDRVQLARQAGLVPARGSRLDVAVRRGMDLLTRVRR